MTKILYLSPFWPDRTSSASEVRSKQIALALQELGEVKFVVVGGEDGPGHHSSEKIRSDVLHVVPVRSFANDGIVRKANWFLNSRSLRPHGMAADERELQRAIAAAGKFDLVWFFKLRTANSFLRWSWPRSVVDIDDVPSMFERSVLNTEFRAQARLMTSMRLWSWKRRERLLDERFSALTVCSESDQQYLRNLGLRAPIRVIPNGYEQPVVTAVRRLADPPRLGFIGIFDHQPNVAGINWFARECWSRIKREIPDVRLRLVGRYSNSPLAPQGPDIDALGWVENPADEISTWASMVVPVQFGAGTRGKIAHAFSLKCPVVSTGLGAYGYDARDGHNMFLAESAEEFADACIRTIREPASAAAMADTAWQQFLKRWTWDAIRPQVRAAAEDALSSTRA